MCDLCTTWDSAPEPWETLRDAISGDTIYLVKRPTTLQVGDTVDLYPATIGAIKPVATCPLYPTDPHIDARNVLTEEIESLEAEISELEEDITAKREVIRGLEGAVSLLKPESPFASGGFINTGLNVDFNLTDRITRLERGVS